MKFQSNLLLLVLLGLALAIPSQTQARDFPSPQLFKKKADGSFSTNFYFMYSNDGFSPAGDRVTATPRERHYDAGVELRGEYSLTDAVSLWLLFPLRYRNETALYTASDWGLGDLEAGVKFRLFENASESIEIGVELAGRFPSGDTDTGTGPNRDNNVLDLPLGTGNSDIELGLLFQEDLSKKLFLRQRVAYRLRFDATVEYLRTNQIPINDGGTIRNLPVGNLAIDWGDEIYADGDFGWKITDRVALRLGGLFLYRLKTKVDNIIAGVSGGNVTFDRNPLIGARGYRLDGKAEAFFKLNPHFFVRAAVIIPILGESFPTLSLVESLIGERYELGVGYDF